MTINSHNSLCFTRAYHLRIDLPHDATVGNCCMENKKILCTRKDLSMEMHSNEGESVSTYPHRPKAEAFSNAVDVVERLHDPTDPTTERTAPPCSAHVQHDDVPRALDPVEDEGAFHQHDIVATVMMKFRRKASPKNYDDMTEV